MIPSRTEQINIFDTFEELIKKQEDKTPEFIKVMRENFKVEEYIPTKFRWKFNKHMGRSREYLLESFINALLLQRILGIPTITLLRNILILSKELRDFCYFDKVPGNDKFTRFKKDFLKEIELFFDTLVAATEPICQKMNSKLASTLIMDTTGIEAYVKENNDKYFNAILQKLKEYAKDKPGFDPYLGAYSKMPSHAEKNEEVRNMHVNGEFCYAHKYAVLTNGLGIIRSIVPLDKEFKEKHKDCIRMDDKTDSPDLDKTVSDSLSLKPVVGDFLCKHPEFVCHTFIGDTAFDAIENYSFLLKGGHGFKRAVIPMNPRNQKYQTPGVDQLGRPFCESANLPFQYADICKGKNRAPRMKWVCPLSVCKKGQWRTSCENPCTESPCGRMAYTYMDDCRLYPGAVPRGTDHWNNIYRQRTVIERTLSYCKDVYAIAHPRTQDRHTISADFIFAGITQLVTLIIANKISAKPLCSLRSLIA